MKPKLSILNLANSAALAVCISIAAMPTAAHANTAMKSEMQDMFGALSNVTQPGVFETSRRGVIAGGSINIRNRIMSTNIVSMANMSIGGGCGGLDFFGGSFSFINKDQFVQLLRTIASNAVSYAFYLALESMSSSIRDLMAELQAKIQDMNKYFGNSCQMARGIVDGGKAALQGARDNEFSLAEVGNSVSDIFGSFTASEGRQSKTEALPEAEVERLTGNITWKALTEQQARHWFKYGGDNLNQAIMSISGTVIVGDDKPTTDGEGTAPEIKYLDGNMVTLRDLVLGGNVSMLVCDETRRCINPNVGSVELKGFSTMIADAFTGSDTEPGIIRKFRSGEPLTDSEKNLVTNLPASAGSLITRLSRIGESFPRSFVSEISTRVALNMANDMIRDFFRSAKTAVEATNQPDSSDAVDRIRAAELMYMQEYAAYSATVMPVSDIVGIYNQYLAAAGAAGPATSESATGTR